jgi:DNA helicase HerA-like ATPase
MQDKPIGKVTATEKCPTSCSGVRFWVHDDVVIRPFDIVRIPHLNGSLSYAIVKDLSYITDSGGDLANYVSSDFGNVNIEPQNSRMGTTIAEAEVLYNTKDLEMPIRDGARVEWADVEGIREALGLKALRNPIPAGYIRNSNDTVVPVEFEGDFLLGPEGAHLNISGISGLATKTTYAMFLLNSIQQRYEQNDQKVTMIIFNVKGNDLLSIDEPCEVELSDSQRTEWDKCGLRPQPFSNVKYLYPFAKRKDRSFAQSFVDGGRLKKQQSESRAWNYFYDVESAKRRLRLLFSDIDDPADSMESIFSHIGDVDSSSWEDFRQDVENKTRKGGASHDKGSITVQSWRKFFRLLQTRTSDDIFCERSIASSNEKKHILVREATQKLTPGDILVIDIAPLPSYLQAFVFGDVVDSVYEAILGGDEGLEQAQLGKIVIFADELNKYAPKYAGKEKTLTGNLLEVTERGRSIGVVLFGAEQFRSGVHDRILGNCSTNVFGRTSPVEVAKCPDYRFFPNNHQWAVQRLKQGELLLQHAIFKTSLIKVYFPMASYLQPKPKNR